MTKSLFAAMAIVLVCAASANAVLTAYEEFNYSPGSNLDTLNGGTGTWNSAWRTVAAPSVTATVATTGLSYPGLQVSGLAGDSTAAATSINFRDIGPFSSGDVWISFLAKPEAANAVNAGGNFFGLSTYDSSDAGSGAVMGIAKNSTTTKWGLVAFPTSTGGSGPHGTGTANFGVFDPASPDIVVNQTYLLVANFHFATGVGADLADTVSLFVDPALGGAPPATASVFYEDTMAPITGQLNFDRIRIASQAGRDWLFDEFRIGTTFADVTPVIPNNPDFNGNGIGLDDFDTIRNNYLTGTLFAQGDANHDGTVNHIDFFIWRSAFTAGGGSVVGLLFFVPEPSTFVPFILGCLVAAGGRRVRRQRDN